jgi:hypothetical protein
MKCEIDCGDKAGLNVHGQAAGQNCGNAKENFTLFILFAGEKVTWRDTRMGLGSAVCKYKARKLREIKPFCVQLPGSSMTSKFLIRMAIETWLVLAAANFIYQAVDARAWHSAFERTFFQLVAIGGFTGILIRKQKSNG